MSTSDSADRTKDQQRQELRALLLDGAASPPASLADDAYFEKLRERVRQRGSE